MHPGFRLELAHPGIDNGIARLALAPSLEKGFRVRSPVDPQPVHACIEVCPSALRPGPQHRCIELPPRQLCPESLVPGRQTRQQRAGVQNPQVQICRKPRSGVEIWSVARGGVARQVLFSEPAPRILCGLLSGPGSTMPSGSAGSLGSPSLGAPSQSIWWGSLGAGSGQPCCCQARKRA